MNKKIKVIDLLNKIANREKVPKKIKILGDVFEWFGDSYRKEDAILEYIADYVRLDCMLNDEIEILEDNTEDIEELDIQSIEEIQFPDNTILRDTRDLIINQLVKAVKQLDKKNDN